MAFRLEWRSRSEGDDTILAIEAETETVVKAWVADLAVLTDFLNDMTGLDGRSRNGVDYSMRKPQEWGELVMARSDSGDVLSVDPALYLGGIAHWFRSQGRDPHPFRTVS